MSSEKGDCRYVEVPCGGCIGCRLDRANGWAVRMMHEARMHSACSFITFTYRDAPFGTSLDYRDFQLFMKRLRKALRGPRPARRGGGSGGGVRFFCAGEYGGTTWRPHFHAALFGFWPSDSVYYRRSPAGGKLYRSDIVDNLWTHGLCAVGTLNFQSAAYIARYCVKKQSGDSASLNYSLVDPDTGEIRRLVPEFAHMSLRPGLGSRFLDSFFSDVFPRDYVVMDGRKVPVPKYYRNLLLKKDIYMSSDLESSRSLVALSPSFVSESSPDRLAVRESVVTARQSFYKRELE